MVVWFLEKRVDTEFVSDFDQLWIPGTGKHHNRDYPALGMPAEPAQEFRGAKGCATVVSYDELWKRKGSAVGKLARAENVIASFRARLRAPDLEG